MTIEQKLSELEGLCERVYEMGKDILDPNVKDTKKKNRKYSNMGTCLHEAHPTEKVLGEGLR